VPLAENLEIATTILPRMKAINSVLEVEIGVVGGEEDGVSHDINEHLYTTLDDAIATVEALGFGEQGRYMAALTFGNVHGVYKPGNVKLKPLSKDQMICRPRFWRYPSVRIGGRGSPCE